MSTSDLTTLILTLAFFSAALIYTIREVLIVVGFLKGPLLRQFEKYGDSEPLHYPLPGLFLALAVFLLLFGFAVEPIMNAPFLPYGPPLLMVAVAYAAFHYRHLAYRYPHIFRAYPRWLYLLRENTDREERRRIAYRWLQLPWRTRLALSSSDHDFLLWADFVVLSTLS
jgi:hypothetical protein